MSRFSSPSSVVISADSAWCRTARLRSASVAAAVGVVGLPGGNAAAVRASGGMRNADGGFEHYVACAPQAQPLAVAGEPSQARAEAARAEVVEAAAGVADTDLAHRRDGGEDT